MKYGHLGFPTVPHKYGLVSRHLEVCPLPTNFVFPSVLVQFMRADEDLRRPREVVDILEANIVNFSYVIFQVQDDVDYPPSFDDPPNAVDFFIVPCI